MPNLRSISLILLTASANTTLSLPYEMVPTRPGGHHTPIYVDIALKQKPLALHSAPDRLIMAHGAAD